MIKMNELENEEKKLKILNLTRCLNCSLFISCLEQLKEDIAECERFDELPDKMQVIITKLVE
jgi:hypothetical protein